MKPLFYSSKEAENPNGIGWYRDGQNICYYQNQLKKKGGGYYYTLTFQVQCSNDDDVVYMAHCYPYTYSDLQEDLTRIEKDSACQDFFYRGTLCRTLAGNRCEYLSITSKDKDPKSAKALAKKGVVISARVHPGETGASYM